MGQLDDAADLIKAAAEQLNHKILLEQVTAIEKVIAALYQVSNTHLVISNEMNALNAARALLVQAATQLQLREVRLDTLQGQIRQGKIT